MTQVQPATSRSRLPLLILALTLAVMFYRLFFGETFFWGLPSLQFYPWREYAFDLIRSGQLPLWNPYNGGGAPLLANYQSALLYPPTWVGLVLPLAWSMSVTAVLHLFLAGWGMWQLTGRLGLPRLGQGVSALAFGLTGYLVARLGTYPTVSAAAWLPWELWATLGILTQFRRRDGGWLALFVGLQLLAGHAQTTWYSLLLIGVFSAWWSVSHRPFDWKRFVVVVGAITLGAGIAAVQLIPTAELLAQSQRSGGVDYDKTMNFSYGLARSLNFLSPNFFGTPGDGSYVTKGAYFEDAVYIGLIPLMSALAAVFSWLWGKIRRAERPAYFAAVPFWTIIVVFAVVLALGKNSPVFPLLYRNIPTFSLFQGPVRWHLWTVFGLSVLAGIGVGAWGHGYWLFFSTRLATAACVGAALLAIAAPRFLPPDVSSQQGVQVIIRAVIELGIVGALAGILTLTQPELPTNRWYGLWSFIVLIVIAADLGYSARGLNPTISTAFLNRLPIINDVSDSRPYWPEKAEEKVKFDTFLPFEDYRVTAQKQAEFRASNLANFNLLDRTYLLNNFDPLLVGRFAHYLKLMEAYPQHLNLLQASGVTGVYNERGELQPLETTGSRAWLVESACWHPDEAEVVEAIVHADWNPLRQVHLFGQGDCPSVSTDTGTPGQLVKLTDSGSQISVELNMQHAGWLVLADVYYPNWTASDNDTPIGTISIANLAFRAVPVSSGQHTIHFNYQPPWLWPGVLVSLVSLLGLLVLFRSRNPNTNG